MKYTPPHSLGTRLTTYCKVSPLVQRLEIVNDTPWNSHDPCYWVNILALSFSLHLRIPSGIFCLFYWEDNKIMWVVLVLKRGLWRLKEVRRSQRTQTGCPTNQSKLVADACSGREARENVWEKVTIGFGFTSQGLDGKVARVFFSQSYSVMMQANSIYAWWNQTAWLKSPISLGLGIQILNFIMN